MNCKFQKSGKHNFIEIARVPLGYDSYKVIEWCENCGTLEIFTMVDNRELRPYNLRPKSVTKSK